MTSTGERSRRRIRAATSTAGRSAISDGVIGPSGQRLPALWFTWGTMPIFPTLGASSGRTCTMIVGESAFRYEVVEGWEQLPSGWFHGDVAGVATDSQDRVYVFNRSEHP